jgi:hypothetical protein
VYLAEFLCRPSGTRFGANLPRHSRAGLQSVPSLRDWRSFLTLSECCVRSFRANPTRHLRAGLQAVPSLRDWLFFDLDSVHRGKPFSLGDQVGPLGVEVCDLTIRPFARNAKDRPPSMSAGGRARKRVPSILHSPPASRLLKSETLPTHSRERSSPSTSRGASPEGTAQSVARHGSAG